MIEIDRALAEYVCKLSYDCLPENVQDKALACILNGIGIGMAGFKLKNAEVARSIVKEYEQSSEGKIGTLFMDGSKVSLFGAIFSNSTLFHSRIQEDTHLASHIGTIVLPVVLGLAENFETTGKEMLEAVVAGYEVSTALGKELTEKTTKRGFRPTPLYGIFGATAAAGKLLKLNADEMTNAFNIAVAFAGGTNEAASAGTWESNFQNGTAAKNGLMAALLATRGITGADTAFIGNSGFIKSYAGVTDELAIERMVQGLRNEYEILNVTFKPYPTCVFNQTPFILTLDLVKEKKIEANHIVEVNYYMNDYESNFPGIRFKGPLSTEVSRIMSTPYTIALAIKEKRLYKSDIVQVGNPEVLDVLSRISIHGDKELSPLCGRIEIRLLNGKVFRKEMIISTEYYAYDWSRLVDLISNVHNEAGISEKQTHELIDGISKLPEEKSINNLIEVIKRPYCQVKYV
jgi:2-methylcitrate dehydratase PrpD